MGGSEPIGTGDAALHDPTSDASLASTGMLDAGAAADGAVDAGPPCVEPAQGLPADVFCTGLYKGRNATLHADDVLPYAPGLKFWSDGAQKDRFLFLPRGSQIDSSELDAWKFPVGTKAWKEFRIDGKLIETRLFWKRSATKWESGTYVWDSATETAPLNTDLKPILLADGYEIPTARDCGKCHEGGSDQLLGIEAIALGLATAEGATLTKLVADGVLSHPPARTTVSLPEDETGKAAAALGYLHVNCGIPCHSTRGLGDETQLVMRLRAEEVFGGASDAGVQTPGPIEVTLTDLYRATVNQVPTTASVEQQFPGAHRIIPGAHDQSLVYRLSHLRGNYQMPPLVSHKVDDAGTQALADWIDALPH
jgi:hypothetical protein